MNGHGGGPAGDENHKTDLPALVVNAGGVWVDRLRHRLGLPGRRLRPSRGSHLVFRRDELPLEAAVTILSPDDRWARIKRRATDAIVDTGDTLSHHHGVGSWHAPWYRQETGNDGWRALERVARELDPIGILNPHVLLDPTDRLEE